MTNASIKRQLMALACAGLFAGCANQPQTLYYWGSYQQQVHAYLKADGLSTAGQIAALEADMQKAQASGKTMPPGYHAHLGLLYAAEGQGDKVRKQFENEKALFPESAPFMDFLLKKK